MSKFRARLHEKMKEANMMPKLDLPVVEFVTPERFAKYEELGLKMGFRFVESGPLVRSSYHAEKHMF